MDGSKLIAKIQSMVKVQGRELHRKFCQEFASLAESQFKSGDLGVETNLLFDIFRKCRREESSLEWGQNRREPDAGDLVKDLLWRETKGGWGRIPKDELYALYIDSRGDFESVLSEFNSSRSRATHVLALFRPFQDRYLSQWATSVSPYPRDVLESRIASIRGTVVHDKIELAIWAEEVFGLFQEAAVFYPEKQVIIQKNPEREGKLPLGMISSQSLRIYGQQWRLWIREFENQIMSTQDKDDKLGESIRSQLARNEEIHFTQGTPKGDSQGKDFEIEIFPELDETLKAKRTWDDKESAILQLADWIQSIGAIWNVEKMPCRARIRARNGSNVSELSVKALNFAEMSSVTTKVIETF